MTRASGLAGRALILGLAGALALWGAYPLYTARAWPGLALLAAVTALIFWVYLTPRRVPLKYLLPGTLFLIACQLLPVAYTVAAAATNFGDGHRGDKAGAIASIQSSSVRQVPGSAQYTLKVATTGDPDSGPLVFLLTDRRTGEQFAGDATGLHPRAGDYTPLNLAQVAARGAAVTDFRVPTAKGAIRSSGATAAYEGVATLTYDTTCDCIAGDGRTWRADAATGYFTAGADHLPQGWQVTVGADNFTRVLVDPAIRGPFLSVLGWNLFFAVASVVLTFALGLGCALALHAPRLRGLRFYRVLLVLPYAMPGFAMLLVWRDMFNADFGLINHLLGAHVDWFGGTWSARAAVLLVQLWLGYPYMFLVSTGALQSIPKETVEAAAIDGAGPWQTFRKVTLPLLLVALSPLLISSFAFNFNNFSAIYLTTDGGPFPADNPTAGATDLLITYTYRLAFGGQGAQYGFAAAVSVYIFLLVAVLSMVGFRRTRSQEETYS